jgi:LysM repeat protein
MNTPSPLVPQGATPPRGKSSLYFKILMILTVHVVVIGGMLLQGCKDVKDQAKQDNSAAPGADPATTAAAAANANTTPAGSPADVPQTLNPNISNTYATTVAPMAPTTQPSTPSTSMTGAVPPAKFTDLATPVAPGDAKDYVIVKGDTLAVIAHKNGISLKALEEANPSVNPKKLQIGQKLQVPAGTAMVATSSASGAAPAMTADAVSTDASGSLYVVKSGDTLSKIAKSHGTSFKRIMAMNDLKTTSIRAGQKLKMPAPKAAPAEPAAAPASASAAPTAAPARVPAATTSPVAAN